MGGASVAVQNRDKSSPRARAGDRDRRPGFPITDTLAQGLWSGQATREASIDDEDLVQGRQAARDGCRPVTRIWPDAPHDFLAGPGSFYRGDLAKNTAAYLKANGGILTEADLAGYRPFEDAPIRVNYRGVDVYECPPNSQGFVMLEALNILEGFNLRQMGHNTGPYLHAVTEALKLSFADRNKYVGDPKFVPNIPMQALLSKEYATARRAAIDPNRAIAGEPAPGDPSRFTPSTQAYARPQPMPATVGAFDPDQILNLTTYLAVVDKDHNMVSVTSSLLSGFGSGMVVENGGFFLNDRMRYWHLDPNDVNALQPGKRVRQTINPALALKDGKPFLVFGTPGADTQPQAQLQFFLNVVEFGMNVQQALEQPAVISNSFATRTSRKRPRQTADAGDAGRIGGARNSPGRATSSTSATRRGWIGEGGHGPSADRRPDGRRQPDRGQLCDGVVTRGR